MANLGLVTQHLTLHLARANKANSASKALLQNVSLTCNPASVNVIVGPNGAGKSTLLHSIAGTQAVQGQVLLDGLTTARLQQQKILPRRLAMLGQRQQLAFSLQVKEVLELAFYPHQLRVSEQQAWLNQVVQWFALSPFISRNYLSLSGGEQARVQLARVVLQLLPGMAVGQTSVLLADEPLAAMDVAQQLSVLAVLKQLAEQGLCIVLVLHDINLALQVADQLILLKEGRVLAAGTREAVGTEELLSTLFDVRARQVGIGDAPLVVFEPINQPAHKTPQ